METCFCSTGEHISSIAIWYIDSRSSAGGKLLKFFTSFVRKTYGIEDEVDGEERVKHLRAIYAALASKGVPNVDWLKDSKIQDYSRGSYADLEPRGKDQSPESPTDIRNAVMCILETLKVVLTCFYLVN